MSTSLHATSKRWSGGAMVLGKLPVPGCPTILIIVGQRPIALPVGAVEGLFGHFYSPLSFLSSFSPLWEAARYRLEILSQRAVVGGRVVQRCWVSFQCRGVLHFG